MNHSLLKMSPPHDHPCDTGLSLGLPGFEDTMKNKLKVRKQTFMSFKFDHLLPPLSLGPSSYQKTMDFGGGGHQEKHHRSICDVGEEEGASPEKKMRLNKDQYVVLEEFFENHAKLTLDQKKELAKQLNLRPRQVEVWFQNRRARTKLKQKEDECEVLKKCCERLTEENERLRKELLELKGATAGTEAPATTPPPVLS